MPEETRNRFTASARASAMAMFAGSSPVASLWPVTETINVVGGAQNLAKVLRVLRAASERIALPTPKKTMLLQSGPGGW